MKKTAVKKGKGKFSQMMQNYGSKKMRDANGKPIVKNMAIKGGMELLAIGVGGALSAGLGAFMDGRLSIISGLAAVVLGKVFDDPTQLSSVAGASMIGYGIAKFEDNQKASKDPELTGLAGAKSKFGEGLSRFSNEILAVIGIKKKDSEEQKSDESVGSIEDSILDEFEKLNFMEAKRFDEQQRADQFEDELSQLVIPDFDGEQEVEGLEQAEFAFSQFDDVDFNNL